MVHADLKGKNYVPEDVLTSNCLGLLRLLPDNNFISFLGTAVALEGQPIDLSLYERMERIEFWPWLPEGGEPDVIVELQNTYGSARLVVVIEVKHGAGKSGGADLPEAMVGVPDNMDNPERVKSDRFTRDQLAKYWRAASNMHFPCLALIYLTHHRWLPKDDIAISLREAGSNARFYWLSWFHLYRWITDQIKNISNTSIAEKRILETLRDYLSAKGYTCFLGWSPLPRPDNSQLVYSHAYLFTASDDVISNYKRTYVNNYQTGATQSRFDSYIHRYGLDRVTMPTNVKCFYKNNQEEM